MRLWFCDTYVSAVAYYISYTHPRQTYSKQKKKLKQKTENTTVSDETEVLKTSGHDNHGVLYILPKSTQCSLCSVCIISPATHSRRNMGSTWNEQIVMTKQEIFPRLWASVILTGVYGRRQINSRYILKPVFRASGCTNDRTPFSSKTRLDWFSSVLPLPLNCLHGWRNTAICGLTGENSVDWG